MLSNSTSAFNVTEEFDKGISSSFHTFPASKWVIFTAIMLPLCFLALPVSVIFHYMSYPFLPNKLGLHSVIIFSVCYFLPCGVMIASALDETDLAFGLAIAQSVVPEFAFNSVLFTMNHKHRVYTRLGSRVLFLSLCVLIGGCAATMSYNNIDYYGPVRVTGVLLETYRPEQQIDTMDPRYYYFYQMEQTLEWGDSWGCPENEDSKWCIVKEDMYKDLCRVRIDCKGNPSRKLDPWCATEEQKKKAQQDIFLCWARKASIEGLDFTDFFSFNFSKTVAPWDDPLLPHTVTRSVTCRDTCRALATLPPDQLVNKALWYFNVGAVLVVIGGSLVVYGKKHDKEHPDQQPVQRPTRPQAEFRMVPMNEVSNDLEPVGTIHIAKAELV